jgi:cold shock CspA family protein
LKKEADLFMSGYLIPNLLPVARGESKLPVWGELKSRVRGICYNYDHDRAFGFLRYLTLIDSNLWIMDTRQEGSPYKDVFAHKKNFNPPFDEESLPSRDIIFEFTLEQGEKGVMAMDITQISPPLTGR